LENKNKLQYACYTAYTHKRVMNLILTKKEPFYKKMPFFSSVTGIV